MKLMAIVGTNADFSYNRILLHYMQHIFKPQAEIQIQEIKDYPPFCEDDALNNHPDLQQLQQDIATSAGVILSSPEYDHAIPACLKSVLEWMSYEVHPFRGKPVMIVGASYGPQGSARAQLQLRQILACPEIDAYALPGNEFLLGHVVQMFDQKGNLTNHTQQQTLQNCFADFLDYIHNLAR